MITFATTGFYLHFISDGKLGLHFADAETSCSFSERRQWVEKLKQMNGNFACKDEDLSASLAVEIAEKIFLWKLCIAKGSIFSQFRPRIKYHLIIPQGHALLAFPSVSAKSYVYIK